jgi:hypothetical protein
MKTYMNRTDSITQKIHHEVKRITCDVWSRRPSCKVFSKSYVLEIQSKTSGVLPRDLNVVGSV